MAAKVDLRPGLGLIKEGGMGHGHPGHVRVLALVHPHLLGKRPDGSDRLAVDLDLLSKQFMINFSLFLPIALDQVFVMYI